MNVFITGASSGIGKELVRHYANQGHQVFACGRSMEKLNTLLDFGDVTPLQFDVTDFEGSHEVISRLPAIDLAILNAGDCEYIKDATQFDAELFHRIININLISVAYQIQSLMPKLLSSNSRSQLVLMGSAASITALPQAEAYGASKAAIAYLADTLYLDLKNSGVDVSRVSPGFVKTPLTDRNHFSMPFIMNTEQAITRIAKGIEARRPHIRFPKRLFWVLRTLALLPIHIRHKILLGKDQSKESQ